MMPYQSVSAAVTGPARTEGAAGTLYAEVPIRSMVVRRGQEMTDTGHVTLKRCNDVPGCTARQTRWHISGIALDGRAGNSG